MILCSYWRFTHVGWWQWVWCARFHPLSFTCWSLRPLPHAISACMCVDSKHIIDIISLNVPNHQHILTVTSVSQNNSRLFIPGFGSNGTIYISTNMTSYILRNVIPFTPHSPCGLKQKGPVRNIVEPCCRKSVCYRTLVQLSWNYGLLLSAIMV